QCVSLIFHYVVSFSTMRTPPSSTLFPYTTLFRSRRRFRSSPRVSRRPSRCERCSTVPPPYAPPSPTWNSRWDSPSRSYGGGTVEDRKSTRLNSSHVAISYAVFCLKKKSTSVHQLP